MIQNNSSITSKSANFAEKRYELFCYPIGFHYICNRKNGVATAPLNLAPRRRLPKGRGRAEGRHDEKSVVDAWSLTTETSNTSKSIQNHATTDAHGYVVPGKRRMLPLDSTIPTAGYIHTAWGLRCLFLLTGKFEDLSCGTGRRLAPRFLVRVRSMSFLMIRLGLEPTGTRIFNLKTSIYYGTF